MQFVLLYAILCVIATAINIGAQDMVVRSIHGGLSVPLSIVAGTGVGLAVKYFLDKRYIFRFRPRSSLHDGRTFLLYSLMGLLTTAVFWAFEFGFNSVFETKEMRYIGGIIGLAIGYACKYFLDRQYVFKKTMISG
jgi:putative flippase GtrA